MKRTVAVDLGKWKCGVATAEDGVVVQCETVKIPKTRTHNSRRMVEAVRSSVPGWAQAETVCEWPQKYRFQRGKHKDLDDLHAVGGHLWWHKRYSPHAWKGNVAKTAFARRLRRVLTEEEARVIPWQEHDAVDALGILLFHLGRIKRGGLEP